MKNEIKIPFIVDIKLVVSKDKRGKDKKPIIGIYKITSPMGKINIGQSVDVYARFYVYKNLGCKQQPHLLNSLKKHGVENHTFEIIHICSIKKLNYWERYYGKLFNVTDRAVGLNIRECGGSKGKHGEETKTKIGNANRGRVMSDEQKLKLSIAHKGKSTTKGRKVKKKTKIKISNSLKGRFKGDKSPHYGKPRSKETKLKLSKAHSGKKLSKSHRENMSKAQKNMDLDVKKNMIEKRRKKMIGMKHSDDSKIKISNARKKYWENIRQERALMIF